MRYTKRALVWIIKILNERKIKYRITGGFAAKLYGCKRSLADIDIEIPEDDFSTIFPFIKKRIIFGPKRYKDRNWQVDLITLNYIGQEIDLYGAKKTIIFNKNTKKWERLKDNFPFGNFKSYKGIKINVINKKDLISYKKKLRRIVDIIDLKSIN